MIEPLQNMKLTRMTKSNSSAITPSGRGESTVQALTSLSLPSNQINFVFTTNDHGLAQQIGYFLAHLSVSLLVRASPPFTF